jgi:iron complex outermembrane recepter protein
VRIEQSGVNNNVLEILRKTVPQFTGNLNLGPTNGNVASNSTNGGSQLSLRNSSTLVLINGRRMAYSPVDALGGFQFVDVNLIPVAAIDRIEILADGASAIYGTDAVSGVVNIILKTDFEGFEFGSRYGWSTNQGHYAERSAYITGGTSNARTSITIGAEWAKSDPIYNYERAFSNPTYGTTTFAGSVNAGTSFYLLGSGLNAPAVTPGGLSPAALVAAGTYAGPNSSGQQLNIFNLSQYVTQVIGNERQSLTLALNHHLNDNLTLFGDFLYAKTQTFSQLNAQPFSATVAPGSPNDPFSVSVTARNRLVDFPRQFFSDTTNVRGVVGLKGNLTSDWTWEAAANYNRQSQDYVNPGLINSAARAAAVDSGLINIFARTQAPGAVAQSGMIGTALGNFTSGLQSYDLRVVGKIFELPAGPAQLAVGAEIRHESLQASADVFSQTATFGWDSGVSIDPFIKGRTIESEFAELRVPVLKDQPGAHLLELSGAVRHEHYTDTPGPTVPKFTVRYLPFNDDFALRGTYSKSFSAPTLFQLFGPSGIGFTDPFTLFPAGGGAPIQNWQSQSSSGSNSSLVPSKSENWTAGLVFAPHQLKGFSLSADYWRIRQHDLISTIGAATILQSVEDLGTTSPYASLVHLGSLTGPGITGAGQIANQVPDDVFVTDRLVNIASTKLDGFDITARYAHTVTGVGRFDLSTTGIIYRHWLAQELPTDSPLETAGHSTDFNGTVPRWLAYTTLSYMSGSYQAFVGNRFIPAIVDDDDGSRIGSWTCWDASVSYQFGQEYRWLNRAKLEVGVNNVLNRMPPRDATIFTDSNADIATYGSIGRFVYVDLKYRF